MVIALLILIALILLFGAGVVKGWLRNIVGAAIGITLLAGLMLTVTSLLGEDAFWWIWLGGGTVLFVGSVWARSYDPEKASTDADLKARIKIAQRQRDERRKKGLKW